MEYKMQEYEPEYIVINSSNVLVNGAPNIFYYGNDIMGFDNIVKFFREIQEKNNDILELHCISSETPGKYGNTGNPSLTPGAFAWARIKYVDNTYSKWFVGAVYSDVRACNRWCAYSCVANLSDYIIKRAERKDNVFTKIKNKLFQRTK